MKIIQSFWAGNSHDVLDAKGWLSAKHHWLGWILSVNQLRKYHDEVELYTDEFGYEILIEKLKLPYTKVHVALDKLNEYPSGLWALAKIETYSLCKTPFIHVDGDVFVWESLTQKFNEAELITQNLEHTTEYYRTMWNNITANINFIPNEMKNFHENKTNNAYNMGIFGGNNLEFIKNYTDLSFDFVDKNKNNLQEVNLFNFNIFFEQVLFYELATEHNKKVEVLINDDIGDNEYRGFGDFDAVPESKTYLHLLGVFKRNELICNNLEQYVLRHYPEYIKLLTRIFIEDFTFFTFKYDFTIEENNQLILYYFEQTINEKVKINDLKSLFSRDLFMQNQLQLFTLLRKKSIPFYIFCLTDFLKEENQIKVFNLNGIEKIIEYDDVDSIIFFELSKPAIFSAFIEKMITYLGDDFSIEDKNEFVDTITLRIAHLIQEKIIAVSEYV